MLERLTYGDKPVRINLDDQGQPWFCLSDVGEVLGMKNLRIFLKSKSCTEDGVRQNYITDSLGRDQEATFINEPNLYALVFRSDKEEAQAFSRWVFQDVLPSIRRTGSYQTPVLRIEEGQDPMLVALKSVMMIRQDQLEQQRQINTLHLRVQAVEDRQHEAAEAALALPAPAEEAPELSETAKCRMAVDTLVSLTGRSHHDIWKEVYSQYDYRLSTKLTAKVENFNASKKPKDRLTKLEYIARFGKIGILYSIILVLIERSRPHTA